MSFKRGKMKTSKKQLIDYPKLYELTGRVTPLERDCGELCGGVCCRGDRESSLGMYLFPGEEAMFTGREAWLHWERRDAREDGFPPSWRQKVHFLRCSGRCPREQRPLSCRFFPLAPHLLGDGTLLLIHETLALPYTCPLIKEKIPLRGDFIETVARCWQELLKDSRLRDLVEKDSRDREKEGIIPSILWWS